MKLSALARLGVEFGVTQWFSVGLHADYQYVSKLMGHTSVKHTEVYARVLNEGLDKAMNIFDTIQELKKVV